MNQPIDRPPTIHEMQHAEMVLRIGAACDNLVDAMSPATKDRKISTIAALVMGLGLENSMVEIQGYVDDFKIMKEAEKKIII